MTSPPPQPEWQNQGVLGGSSKETLEAQSQNADVPVQIGEKPTEKPAEKRELLAEDCEDQLAFAFPTWYKWWILTVIFLVQTSMNFNTSLYSNGKSSKPSPRRGYLRQGTR